VIDALDAFVAPTPEFVRAGHAGRAHADCLTHPVSALKN